MEKEEFLSRMRTALEHLRAGNERIMHVSDLGFHNLNDDVINATTPAARASAYSILDNALTKGSAEFAAGYHEMRLALDEYAVLLDEWLGGDRSASSDAQASPASLLALRNAHSQWVEYERKLEDWAVGLDEMSKQAAEGPPELNVARAAFQEAAIQVQSDSVRAREQFAWATALLEDTSTR